jgi:hypothetical protein
MAGFVLLTLGFILLYAVVTGRAGAMMRALSSGNAAEPSGKSDKRTQ